MAVDLGEMTVDLGEMTVELGDSARFLGLLLHARVCRYDEALLAAMIESPVPP